MILTWVLVSLAILTSGSPQNRRNVIIFPGEVNIDKVEDGDGLEEFNNNPGDKLWFPDNESDYSTSIGSDDSEPFTFIREEDYFDLPDWMAIDLNELSLDKLAVLNNASDLTDLVEFFGLDYEKAINMSGQTNITRPEDDTEIRSSIVVKKNDELAQFAKCRPEKKTVVLTVPKGSRYIPTCVRLMQCGGCCNSKLLECQPTKTEVVSLTVLKITKEKRSPKRGRQRGRRTSGQLIPMDHENHVECVCQCKVQEKHCNSVLHNYNEDACACDCKEKAEQMKCESSIRHKWNNDTCSCMCKKKKDCSTGEFYSQETCRCAVGSG